MAGGLDHTDDGTWRYTWPAGERMLSELDHLIDPRGKVVVDIGCGRGRLGRWALEHGAAQVVFADQSTTALAAVMELVGSSAGRTLTLEHCWGAPLPAADLVLGGDILYRSLLFAVLLRSLATAVKPNGMALLADPRVHLEPELPHIASDSGLSWSSERRPTGYTLCRLASL
ncbi:MAG: methyltransferase domain-containing protein [Planctomycetota bacterium]